MSMIQLLEGITSRIGINEFGVSKIVLLDNMIVIEGVISIADVSKNESLDYDYRVATRDSVETFVNSRLVTDTVIKELKSIENFKSGTTVEKQGKKYMLVPAEGNADTFYRLDLDTLEVDTERMDKVDLYKEEYYLEGEER